jgi:hypothetical protein
MYLRTFGPHLGLDARRDALSVVPKRARAVARFSGTEHQDGRGGQVAVAGPEGQPRPDDQRAGWAGPPFGSGERW